ncbi:hypothetical protein [Methylobacter sp. sgz302048]
MWLKIKSSFAHLLAPNEDLQDAFERDFYEGLYGIPTGTELKKCQLLN